MTGSPHLILCSLIHGKGRAFLDLECIEPGSKAISEFECILVGHQHDSVSEVFCFPESEPWAVDDTDLSTSGVVLNKGLGL